MMQLVLWIVVLGIWDLLLIQAVRHTNLKAFYKSVWHSSENIVSQECVTYKKKGWTER